MTAPARSITAEEFLRMPGPPEGGKMELVDGEVVRMVPVGGIHGQKSISIQVELAIFARAHGLGEVFAEVGFVLGRDPDQVRAPDVAFLAAVQVPSSGLPEGFIEGAPTLAVEVKSPEDRESEILRKVAHYLDAGTQRVWVVRPRERTVTVHRVDSQVTRSGGESLSSGDAGFATDGFGLAIDELFA